MDSVAGQQGDWKLRWQATRRDIKYSESPIKRYDDDGHGKMLG